jgi:hypothetical protein
MTARSIIAVATRCVCAALVGLFLTGCAQTLRSQYIDANDPCSPAREPIVKAGDDLNARDKQLADQQAAQQMQGQMLPETTQMGTQIQVNFANILANAIKQAQLSNQAYIALKQRENGSNAAALLASVESDASNDRSKFTSVQIATQRLRECRGTQILNAKTVAGPTEAQRQDKLREQQVKLNQDDQLIATVFGDYAKQAAIYTEASSTVGSGHTATRIASGRRQAKAPPKTAVQEFSDEERAAQIADRKQSETMHETLQSSISGS